MFLNASGQIMMVQRGIFLTNVSVNVVSEKRDRLKMKGNGTALVFGRYSVRQLPH